jgi:hypothetical protein
MSKNTCAVMSYRDGKFMARCKEARGMEFVIFLSGVELGATQVMSHAARNAPQFPFLALTGQAPSALIQKGKSFENRGGQK